MRREKGQRGYIPLDDYLGQQDLVAGCLARTASAARKPARTISVAGLAWRVCPPTVSVRHSTLGPSSGQQLSHGLIPMVPPSHSANERPSTKTRLDCETSLAHSAAVIGRSSSTTFMFRERSERLRVPHYLQGQMFSPQKNAAPIRSAIGWLEKTRGKRN